MLKEERHNIILTEIKAHNRVYSNELSKLLQVSEDTVRRDLHELARLGQIRKVHGGAMGNPVTDELIHLDHDPHHERRAKIAAKASSCIMPHSVALLDGALINLMIVDYLPRELTATVFTNSLQVASKLFDFPYMETILLGGRLSNKQRITVGMDVIHSLSEIHADLCLMEISSVHESVGLSEDDKEIANTKKAMIKSSSKVAAMTLKSSVGSKQPFKVCPLNTINMIITEADPADPALEKLASRGVQIK